MVVERCARCRADAELGRCPGCDRDLCVTCYDADSAGYCWFDESLVRDQEIVELRRDGMEVDDIAERYGLSRRSVHRVLAV